MKRLFLLAILLLAQSAWGAVYYASPTGSGTTCSLVSPCTVNYTIGTKASAVGDEVVLLAGTYNYVDGSELDYTGVLNSNITIRGVSKDSVVLDFGGSGDASGWLNVFSLTNVTIKDLTIKNFGTTSVGTQVLYLLGNSSGVIQNIKFQDVAQKAINITGGASQGTWTIKYNEFCGIKSIGAATSAAYFVSVDGSTNPVTVDIYYNIFRPSANSRGSGVFLAGSPAASRTVNIYNNEFYGAQGYNIYVGGDNYTGSIKNNIFAGAGVAGSDVGYKAIEGSCAGYATTVDYNINLGSNQTPAFYDSQITAGANDKDGAIRDIKKLNYPNKGYFVFTFDDASGWNTAGWTYLYSTFANPNGWKITTFIDVKAWDTRHGGTPPGAELTAYLADGNEVGTHGFSHSDVTVTANALQIKYTGGGSKNVTIATNTDNSGVPDWNTIATDYTTWTGTITLQDAGTINLLDGNGFFKSLAQISAEINTTYGTSGWVAAATGSGTGKVSSGTPAIALAEGVTAVGSVDSNFAMQAVPYIWLETKYAKDRLESIITAVTGSPYTVKSWGSPYNQMDANAMDCINQAGYSVARGEASLAGVTSSSADLRNIARFNVYNIGSDGIMSGSDSSIAFNTAAFSRNIMTLPASGKVAAVVTHTSTFDNAAERSAWSSVSEYFKSLESKGLEIVTMGQLSDYVLSEDCSITTGTGDGSDERRVCINSDLYNGRVLSSSPCINKGANVGLTTDFLGKNISGIPDIGAYEYYGTRGGGRFGNFNFDFGW